MSRLRTAIAAAAAAASGALLLSGCAAINEFLAAAPIDIPQPSLPSAPPPFEKIYQGGSRPEGISDEEWATKSERRIVAAGALHGILVFGVDQEGTTALTVKVKGDPEDTQLIDDVETYVVPVALAWAPTVTVIVDSSLCSIAGELRDDTPLCDKLEGN